MKTINCFVAFVFLILICFSESKVINSELEVKFVSILFRHGDRAPKDDGSERYPNDPYLKTEYPPGGAGQLTNIGKKRMFDFGQRLRQRYNNSLDKIYKPSEILAITTDYDRTKMSLGLLLAGLFPPPEQQKWNVNLNWQPAVIHYTPIGDDYLLLPHLFPQYERELEKVRKLPEIHDKLNSYSELMKNLTELTGKPITTFNNMYYIYYTLLEESRLGLELPAWTRDYYPNPDGQLYDATTFEYEFLNYNENLRRLNGGTLLKNITDTMFEVREGRHNKKLHLFSGHETNIASLLMSLGIWKQQIPDYSSAVIIELLSNGSNYYVRVFQHLGIPADIIEKNITGCSQPCPLDDFKRLLRRAMPTDDEIECFKTWKMGDSKYTSCPSGANDSRPGLIFSMILSASFLFINFIY